MKSDFVGNMFGFVQKSRQQKREKDLASFAFFSVKMPMMVIDNYGKIILSNKAVTQLTGYGSELLEGRNVDMLESKEHDTGYYEGVWLKMRNTGSFDGELLIRRRSGEYVMISLYVSKLEVPWSEDEYYTCIMKDITEKHRQEERYFYLANHDPLTGLANRGLFEDRIEHAIANAKRTGEKVGVVIIDMNEFKQINDTYGHSAGDAVLKHLAAQITAAIRQSDTAARYGGDEFILILEHIVSKEELSALKTNLLKRVDTVVPIGNEMIDISFSIGEALFPEDGASVTQLINKADHRMYEGKAFYYGLQNKGGIST